MRDARGSSLGRVILFDESSYVKGMDSINVSLLRVSALSPEARVKGFQCYIDGVLYQVSKNLADVHVVKRGNSYIVTNVCLKRV